MTLKLHLNLYFNWYINFYFGFLFVGLSFNHTFANPCDDLVQFSSLIHLSKVQSSGDGPVQKIVNYLTTGFIKPGSTPYTSLKFDTSKEINRFQALKLWITQLAKHKEFSHPLAEFLYHNLFNNENVTIHQFVELLRPENLYSLFYSSKLKLGLVLKMVNSESRFMFVSYETLFDNSKQLGISPEDGHAISRGEIVRINGSNWQAVPLIISHSLWIQSVTREDIFPYYFSGDFVPRLETLIPLHELAHYFTVVKYPTYFDRVKNESSFNGLALFINFWFRISGRIIQKDQKFDKLYNLFENHWGIRPQHYSQVENLINEFVKVSDINQQFDVEILVNFLELQRPVIEGIIVPLGGAVGDFFTLASGEYNDTNPMLTGDPYASTNLYASFQSLLETAHQFRSALEFNRTQDIDQYLKNNWSRKVNDFIIFLKGILADSRNNPI